MKGVGRFAEGEAVEVPRCGRRRREITEAEALATRARLMLQLHEDSGLCVLAVSWVFGMSERAVRRDLQLARQTARLNQENRSK